jgi:hypothetical protein
MAQNVPATKNTAKSETAHLEGRGPNVLIVKGGHFLIFTLKDEEQAET